MDPHMDPKMNPAMQILGDPDQRETLQGPFKVYIDPFFYRDL